MKTFELISEKKKKNLTQLEISNLLNLSITQYSKKERGKVDFTNSEIKKIKTILNLTPERINEIFLT